jgi:hypothetical protein
MLETALIMLLSFGGGYFAGHKNSTETIVTSCKSEPLIIAECIDINPPVDNTFGATTNAYVDLVGRYKSCKAACTEYKNTMPKTSPQ